MTLFRQQSNSTKTLTGLLYCLKKTRQKNTLPGLNQLVVEKQNLIQLVCCVAVHLFGHMRVDVERGADIAMTESALDRLDVNAMLNHQGC